MFCVYWLSGQFLRGLFDFVSKCSHLHRFLPLHRTKSNLLTSSVFRPTSLSSPRLSLPPLFPFLLIDTDINLFRTQLLLVFSASASPLLRLLPHLFQLATDSLDALLFPKRFFLGFLCVGLCVIDRHPATAILIRIHSLQLTLVQLLHVLVVLLQLHHLFVQLLNNLLVVLELVTQVLVLLLAFELRAQPAVLLHALPLTVLILATPRKQVGRSNLDGGHRDRGGW